MAYRPSSRPLETAWARHLDAVRRERDWSAQRLFEETREALRLGPKSRAAFLPMLSSDEPKAEWVPQLVALYGAPPKEPEAPAPPAAADVAEMVRAMTEALQAQTRAYAELHALFTESRRTAQEERAEMTELLGVLAAELDALRGSVGTGGGSSGPESARQ